MPSRTELLQDTFDRIQRKETRLRAAPTDESTLREIEQQIQTLAGLDTPPPGTTTEIMRLGREKIRIGKTLREFDERLKRLESAKVRIITLLEARSLTGLTAEQLAIYIELLEVQELGGFGDVDVGQTFWREYVESTSTTDAGFERFYRAITDPASVKAEAKARLVKVEKRQAPDQQPPEPEGGQTHLEVLTTLLNTSSADKPLTIEQIYTHVWGGEYSPQNAAMVYNLVSAARRLRPGFKIVKSKDGYYRTILEPATGEPSQIEAVATERAPNRSPRENTHTSRILEALRGGPLTVIDIYRILNPDFTDDRIGRLRMQRVYNAISEARKRAPGYRIDCIDGQYTLIEVVQAQELGLAAARPPTTAEELAQQPSLEEKLRAQLIEDSKIFPLGLSPEAVGTLSCAAQARLHEFTNLMTQPDTDLTKSLKAAVPSDSVSSAITALTAECVAVSATTKTEDPIMPRSELLLHRKVLFEWIRQFLENGVEDEVTQQLENSNPNLLQLLNYFAELNYIRVRFPHYPDVDGEITAYDLLVQICSTDGKSIFEGRVPRRYLVVDPWIEHEQPAQPAQPASTTTIVNFVDRLPNPVKPLVATGEVAPAAAPIDMAAEPKRKKPPHPKPVRPEKTPKEKLPEFGSEDYCRPFIIAEIRFLLTKKNNIISTDQLFNPSQIVRMVGKKATRTTLDPALNYVKRMENRKGVPYYGAVGVITALVILRNRNLPPQSLSRIQEWVEVILSEIQNGKLEIS